MKQKLLALLIFSLMFTLSFETLAGRGRGMKGQGNGPGMGQGRGCGPEFMFEKINLTKEQKEKLVAVKKSHREDMMEVKDGDKELQHEMMEALSPSNFDEAKAKKLATQIADNKKKRLFERIEMMKKIKEILTEEQWKEMEFRRMWSQPQRRNSKRDN